MVEALAQGVLNLESKILVSVASHGSSNRVVTQDTQLKHPIMAKS